MNWVGLVFPVGKITADQMRGIARIAREHGDGDIRLTVWQNLLLSGVRDENMKAVEDAVAALGLSTKASAVRAGLVACTGNTGCRFAASDTKRHADAIASRRTWLQDFENDEITISADLYEVLLAYRYFRRPSA